MPYLLFLKKRQNLNYPLLQNVGGALRVKVSSDRLEKLEIIYKQPWIYRQAVYPLHYSSLYTNTFVIVECLQMVL